MILIDTSRGLRQQIYLQYVFYFILFCFRSGFLFEFQINRRINFHDFEGFLSVVFNIFSVHYMPIQTVDDGFSQGLSIIVPLNHRNANFTMAFFTK